LRGPTSTPSESIVVAEPSLVFCSASRARRATIVSYAAASTTTRVAAVQSCPALKYAATAMSAAAVSRSASAKTTTGACQPGAGSHRREEGEEEGREEVEEGVAEGSVEHSTPCRRARGELA